MIKRAIVTTLALLIAAFPLFPRGVDLSPGESRIRLQLRDLSEMYAKLSMLTRIAGDQDRQRLEAKIAEMQEKARTYGDRLDGILRDADQLVAERRLESELDGLNGDVSRYVSGCRDFMDQVRKRVMTVRRVPAAVRTSRPSSCRSRSA
jgi:hypothetical protein